MKNRSAQHYINIARITFSVSLCAEIAFRIANVLTKKEIWILYLMMFTVVSSFLNFVLLVWMNLANTDKEKDKAVFLNSLLLMLSPLLPFLFTLIF